MKETHEIARDFNTPELRSTWVKRWDKIGEIEFEVKEGTIIDIEDAHDALVGILTVEEYESFDEHIARLFREEKDGEIVHYIATYYIKKVTPKKRLRIKKKPKPKPKLRIKRKA